MLKARAHTLTRYFIVILDVLFADTVLLIMTECYNFIMPSLLFSRPKAALVMLTLCVLIASLLFPPILHYRRVNMFQISKRIMKFTFCFVWMFIIFLRIAGNSGHLASFGIVLCFCMFASFFALRSVERFVLGKLRAFGRNTKTVLFVGNDPALLMIYEEILSDPTTGYRMLGYYSDEVMKNAPVQLKRLGSYADLRNLINGVTRPYYHADELFCSLSHNHEDTIRSIMEYCDRNMTHFFYVPIIFHSIQMSLHPEKLGNSIVFTNYHEPLQFAVNRMTKRLFDIVFSSIILVFLLPFIPVIALIIKIQSPGGIFFRQERTGLNGKTFTCYKFRSMHINDRADKIQATKNDPRKFPFGNFMRKTNIDELPQFFNVLRGEMSVVGPRPHMLYHTEKYSALIKKYMVRHISKPGITGWAQVTGFRGETSELWQMEGRIKKDIWYIEHWSLWLDIKIICMTAWSVIHPDKAAY